jgi:DHA1 family multidrug resistance protein-like MFS transporter
MYRSLKKKSFVTAQLMLLTSGVYMGSSIWTPGIMDGMQYFGLGQVTVTLGLTLFVVGYGIGPLFLSPITEIPHVGRTTPYIVTLAIFTVLQVPTALVTNFAGFAILRFLAGFVGSPPLATGGASISDMYSPHKLPYAMGLWGLSAGSAPAIAPIVSGFAVMANGWRWAFWIMLWLAGGTLLILAFFLPEVCRLSILTAVNSSTDRKTSAQAILLRRAQRLRKLTGNDKIHSKSELDTKHMGMKDIVWMSLIRPISMTFTEPIVLAIDLYIGLVYVILYSYFESFPLVYGEEGYGWNLGVSTLPFVSLLIGAVCSFALYAVWNRYVYYPIALCRASVLAAQGAIGGNILIK